MASLACHASRTLSRPVRQVEVAAGSVAAGLVLDPAPPLVQLRVRQLHDVERVRDLSPSGRASVNVLP